MGDQWYSEELFRQRCIINQLNKKPVVFPQTIFYSNTESGSDKLKRSKKVYDNSEITLIARERISYNIMKEAYPNATVLLTPDIVLSSKMEDFGVENNKRQGILFITRNDPEKAIDESVWDRLTTAMKSFNKHISYSDMHSNIPIAKKDRLKCISMKMQEFCNAEIVITDRLHGMIFAALTGTPCIVFSNNNHKVKGTYDWIRYLPYIYYADTVEEAEKVIPSLIAMKECVFDHKPLDPYFEALADYINNLI